jgi:hypothetical protein
MLTEVVSLGEFLLALQKQDGRSFYDLCYYEVDTSGG